MDNRERQAAFKAAMRSKGLVQLTDWVPSEHRETFKTVARALREGLTVTIGAAPETGTSNARPEQSPETGTSNKTEPIKAPSNRKVEDQQRQARYADQWNEATEYLRVVNYETGKGYDARVTGRRTETVVGMLGDRVRVERVEGILRKGARYQSLAFGIWENVGIRIEKPRSGWKVVPDDLIASAKRRVRDLHPDKGGPGGDEFNAALAALNALRGRA